MGKSGFAGEFEQMVMLAILRLDGDATAPAVSLELEERAGRRVSRGSLYATLERLEGKEWVHWEIGAPAPERGGYRKRRFELTENGVAALVNARRAMASLAAGLDDVLAARR